MNAKVVAHLSSDMQSRESQLISNFFIDQQFEIRLRESAFYFQPVKIFEKEHAFVEDRRILSEEKQELTRQPNLSSQEVAADGGSTGNELELMRTKMEEVKFFTLHDQLCRTGMS